MPYSCAVRGPPDWSLTMVPVSRSTVSSPEVRRHRISTVPKSEPFVYVVCMDHFGDRTHGKILNVLGMSQRTSKEFDQLFHDIVYHPIVKGVVLQGHSRSSVAYWLRRRKRDVLDIAGAPFDALGRGKLPGIDAWGVFSDFWDHCGDRFSAEQALIDCIIYDGQEWPEDRPVTRLARYRVDKEWILGVVARYAIPSDDDESARMADDAETAASLLGCSDADIATARHRHSRWSSPLRNLEELGEIVRDDYPRSFAIAVARGLLAHKFIDEIPKKITDRLIPPHDYDLFGDRPSVAIVAARRIVAEWADDAVALGHEILLRDVGDLLDWGKDVLSRSAQSLVSTGRRVPAPDVVIAELIWALRDSDTYQQRKAASWAYWTLCGVQQTYGEVSDEQEDLILAAGGINEIITAPVPEDPQEIRALLEPAVTTTVRWLKAAEKEGNKRHAGPRDAQRIEAIMYVLTIMQPYCAEPRDSAQ